MNKLKDKFQFYFHLYEKFGIKAVMFLLRSKFKINKTKGIILKDIKFPITLSNFKYDVTTLFQIFFAKEYDIKLKRSPKIIIDCGANIGLSAIYFANKFPDAKIIAIEPVQENFRFLLLNASRYENITCLQKAVWAYPVRLDITDPGRGNWGFQTKELHVSNAETVDAITIDELIEQYGIKEIDLLKFDIEGAEKELFSLNYDKWLSKTKAISIELHDFLDPSISTVFFNAVAPYRFSKYQLGENLILEKETI